MIVWRRHILPWVLSLLIALTGQAAAVAHAAPGPSGQIELCTGTGPVMVYVDENGEPMGSPVYCPDFALSLILALDAAPVLPMPVDAVISQYRPEVARAVLWIQVSQHRLARGPPPVV